MGEPYLRQGGGNVDGYDLSGQYMRNVTDEQIVGALREAGITPDEWNAPPPEPTIAEGAMKPEARYLFALIRGKLWAWRQGEPRPWWDEQR